MSAFITKIWPNLTQFLVNKIEIPFIDKGLYFLPNSWSH